MALNKSIKRNRKSVKVAREDNAPIVASSKSLWKAVLTKRYFSHYEKVSAKRAAALKAENDKNWEESYWRDVENESLNFNFGDVHDWFWLDNDDAQSFVNSVEEMNKLQARIDELERITEIND